MIIEIRETYSFEIQCCKKSKDTCIYEDMKMYLQPSIKIQPSINTYPIYKENYILENKTKTKKIHWLKINEWFIKMSCSLKVGYYILNNFLIESFEINCSPRRSRSFTPTGS